MGIDAKETGAILWKVLGFSMNTIIKFMRNHPILSGVFMLLLAIYIFLPSLLFFLIYSSPVLACALVYARERLGLRFSGSHKVHSSSRHLRQQRSVRRNARMKVEEWDSQTSEEENKDKVILTSLYNDLLGRTPHFEESPKAAEDNGKTFGGDDSGTSSIDLGHLNGMVCNCEINEDKFRELNGKEETREEMSNVNEHGISEIERNRRLESLIARRRARRLFRLALDQRNKLQAEETTSPTQNNNLQVTVPRNNNNNIFDKRRNFSSDIDLKGLQMPGSAPSVMLQGRNPFDIPYDPQEERPNLTGDSFDEEFSLFSQKDMFFCRHESFCRFSLFSPQHAQYLDNEYMDQTGQKRLCDSKELEDEDDDDTSVESGKSRERDVDMNEETDSNKEEGDDSSCSEESESELSRLNKAELREAICHSMDIYPNVLVNQTRNSIPSLLPRAVVAPRPDDNNMLYTRRCANSHSRTFSIASDMQVEVSEIGSPPTTVDWFDDWSNGGESYMYDTDIDREIVRCEESRKRLSHQYESRSGIGSKEETNEPRTKTVAKPDQEYMVDENLVAFDDTTLSDRKSQNEEDAKQVAEEIFEQKPSSSSKVFEHTNSGKIEGLLFHSVSLSAITEEPETTLDSINRSNSEYMKYINEESTDQRSLTSLDSSTKKLIDAEVVDVKENDALFGHPKTNDLDNIQGDHDKEINMKEYETTKPREYEATQSFLDVSLDTPYIKSFEREMEEEEEEEEEEEPNLGYFIEDKTRQPETEALQSDLTSSQGHVLTELLENEVMEENEPKLVEYIDQKAEPIEEETTQIILEGSPSHPHTQLTEDYSNIETDGNVRFLQVQEGNSLTSNNSTDQESSKERENSGLVKDLYAELTQEHNNRTNAEEESVVSANINNSQDSPQCSINSSGGISPRALEIAQQPEHEDVIVSNTVFQENPKDESVAVANDSLGSENNDEENLKLNDQIGEAMEKKLELVSEPMNHGIGLVAREAGEESMQVVETMHIAQPETTKEESRVSED